MRETDEKKTHAYSERRAESGKYAKIKRRKRNKPKSLIS